MSRKFKIGGHRGMGQTDSPFFQDIRRNRNEVLPTENTLESFAAAYRAGCDYIETDAVMSADGVLFTVHNVVPTDHFFGAKIPPAPLNLLPFNEISKFNTGPDGRGSIALFDDMLDLVAAHDPQTLPWAVNVEIKGVQRTPQAYDGVALVTAVAKALRDGKVPEERLLLSSFSLENLIRMSHLLPRAQYAMLFKDRNDTVLLYAGEDDNKHRSYLPFDDDMIRFVLDTWQQEAAPATRIKYMHPQIDDVTPDKILLMQKYGLGVNAWEFMKPPTTPDILRDYETAADNCAAHGVDFTLISDYIDAFPA